MKKLMLIFTCVMILSIGTYPAFLQDSAAGGDCYCMGGASCTNGEYFSMFIPFNVNEHFGYSGACDFYRFTSSVCGGSIESYDGSCWIKDDSSTTTSIDGVVIRKRMMTRNPKPNTECQIPVPVNTFYQSDDAAYCWFLYKNADVGEECRVEWYAPYGQLYIETSGIYEYSSGCWSFGISIRDFPPANTLGKWRVDVYYDGNKKFTNTFRIISCPVENLYGESAKETELLRHLRDNFLSKTREGKELIRLYYEWNSLIVEAMEEDEQFKGVVKEMIDGVLGLIAE